ncbi:MAG: DASS family sodium-coupled anion symporter [Thermoanaerobaculia bacterium]
MPDASPNERSLMTRERIGLIAGPVIFALMLSANPPSGMTLPAWHTSACGIFMAIWWISEALPIAATALLPLVLFPLLGVLKIDAAAAPYANPIIFLFLGGFILAAGLEESGLHRRIALSIIRVVGTRSANLVGGFMIATALLSMWVSNTATVMMMLPITLSVIRLTNERSAEPDRNLATSLLLGIAYAASIGGLGTLIGTPPNALLAGFVKESYHVEIGFGQWMLVGVPLVAISLPLCWLLLAKILYPARNREIEGGAEIIAREIRSLGAFGRSEAIVAIVGSLTALAWMFRPLLARFVHGLSDTGIAIAGGLALFVIPTRWRSGERVISWKDVERLPWGVLILFGGGLSLAHAVESTGLAEWIGGRMSGLEGLPVVVITLVVTTVIVFLTELTSNTATAAAFLPLVGSLAIGLGMNPLFLAVPAALGASCAFMMPVATPPNALVYASGDVTIPQMAKAGLWLNLIFIVLINAILFTIARPVLNL